MQRIFTLLKSGKSLSPAAGHFFGLSTLSMLALLVSVWSGGRQENPMNEDLSRAIQNEPNAFVVDAITAKDQVECGAKDGRMTVSFVDNNPIPSTYRIELARRGKPAMVYRGFTGSPIVMDGMYPGSFSVRIIRDADEFATEYVDQVVNTACEGFGFRGPEDACGEAEDLVFYENCEGFKVYIPESLFEANTFIFVDDDHVGCLAYVDEDCNIQPSTRVYCADFELEVPFWEYTFFDDDPLDGIPTVISLKSYSKQDIGLTGLEAARINYVMCHSEGYTNGEINDAIWGILGQLEDFPVSCNTLCQDAKINVPEGTNGDRALEVIVTYKSPSPEFQDFVEQVTEDNCIDCFTKDLQCFSSVGGGAFMENCDLMVCPGESVTFDPRPDSLSGWNWIGPNGFTSTDRQITIENVTPQDTGTYVVTYAESDTCLGSKAFTLNLISAPQVTVTSSDPTCDEANGFISFEFADDPDREMIEFSLDGGGTFQDPVADNSGFVTYGNLAAGTYDLIARWGGGECPVDLGEVTLTNLASPTVEAGADQFICAAGTVKLEAMATGGNGTLTFIWSVGDEIIQDGPNSSLETETTETTTYTITVVDELGCFAMDNVIVSLPEVAIAVEITEKADVECKGEATGSATASASGGDGQYAYEWSNGNTTAMISDLLPGEYSVTVTDGSGCKATTAVSIAEPAEELQIDIMSSNGLLCQGDSTANVTVAVSGGTPDYSIAWSNGATGETAMNLSAGTYGITATDANGCMAVNTVTVMEPSAIEVSFDVVDVECSGGNTGTITANISGGTPDYTIMWSTGANGMVIENLEAGTYGITVTDANGCMTEGEAVVNASAMGLMINVEAQTDVACKGEATGSLTISAGGGLEPYEFTLPEGLTLEDGTINNLAAGSYQIMVMDGNGCTADTTVSILEPEEALGVVIASQTDVGCNGELTGGATAMATGGTGTYTYTWSNGGMGESISDLPAGVFTVTVNDENGCEATAEVTISEPAPLVIVLDSLVHVACGGETNGRAVLSASGGTEPYAFVWNDGFEGDSREDLVAGEYSVTVTDANNCMSDTTFMIVDSEGLQLDIFANDITCNGFNDGRASATANGGVEPYTFEWSNGGTTAVIEDLMAGTYSVTVSDNEGCTAEGEVAIAEPEVIAISIDSVTNISCDGPSAGSIAISVSGGTGDLAISWSNGADATTLTDLAAGTYTVSATDANGCVASEMVEITTSGELVLEVTATKDVTCNGAADGSITVAVSGGSEPDFIWSNGAETPTISDLEAGTYSVTVSDGEGCTAETSITISEPDPIVIDITKTDVTCQGAFDGTLNASVMGGTGPYLYDWSFGADVPNIDGIMAGDYSLTVTDVNGCADSMSVTIEEGGQIALTLDIADVSCRGGANGSIDLTIDGGSEPYLIEWSNGAVTEDLMDLEKGVYEVTVTDANDCSAVAFAEIDEADSNIMGFVNTMLMEDCQREVVGMARASAVGGVPPYTYEWSTGATTQVVNELPAGNYKVTITDANGCSIVEHLCLEIEQEVKWGGQIGYSKVMCGNGRPGMIESLADPYIEGTDPGDYAYSWQKSTTQCDDDVRIWGMDWEKVANAAEPSYDPGMLTESTYFIRYARKKGDTEFLESNVIFIEVINELSVDAGYDIFSCSGEPVDLEAVVSGGGSVPYAYEWDHELGAGASHTVYPEENTTYTVTVTNEYGCVAVDRVNIITRPSPSVSAEVKLEEGQDHSFCMNEVVTLEARVGQGARTAGWETEGDGTFTSTLGLVTQYTIGEKDAANGYVVIRAVTAQVIGTCPDRYYEMELSVNTSDSEACSDQNFRRDLPGNMESRESALGTVTLSKKEIPVLVGDEANSSTTRSNFHIYPNRPNPFTQTTIVSFELPQEGEVTFNVFDANGRMLHSRRTQFGTGYNQLTFEKGNLPSGVLYYSLEIDGHRHIRKMVITE